VAAFPAARFGLARILPLVFVTPVVAFFVTMPLLWFGAIMAAIVALPSAALVGVPALGFALSRGWTTFGRVTFLGAIAGAVPLLLWGLFVGFWDLSFRPTLAFVIFEALAVLIGATSGAVHWLLFLGPPNSPSPAASAGLSVLAIALGWAVVSLPAFWPDRTWPKFRERRHHLEVAWTFGSAVDPAQTREVRVWAPNRTGCVASIYLPELSAFLERERPGTVRIEIVEVTASWTQTHVRVERIGPIVSPILSTAAEGCLTWHARAWR
jgi:hypothetical protein